MSTRVSVTEPLTRCPKCREPFEPFLRGQVTRFAWFGLRKRIYSLICYACKEIVGHEEKSIGIPMRSGR